MKTKQGHFLQLTTFDIKVIGLVLMVIDHFHQNFAPFGAPAWLDWFGRPVATLFFFTAVVGFAHTHSKKTYMLRLYISMVVMAILMNLTQQIIGFEQVQLINNIFRDLFIGTIFMAAIDQFEKVKGGHAGKHISLGVLLFLWPFLLSIIMMPLLASSGSISLAQKLIMQALLAINPAIMLAENGAMVLLIPIMYIFRNVRWAQLLSIVVVAAIYGFFGSTQWMMIFAIIPIALYNGTKGRGMKYFFYIFYPAHLIFLYALAAWLY